jgi:hypothetical protein
MVQLCAFAAWSRRLRALQAVIERRAAHDHMLHRRHGPYRSTAHLHMAAFDHAKSAAPARNKTSGYGNIGGSIGCLINPTKW